MAKDYAESFYNSSKWKKCRLGYMQSINYICENCKDVAIICHHKEHITPENIDDPMITLNWDNLSGLCQECHNKVHGNSQTITEGLAFDMNGNVIQAK